MKKYNIGDIVFVSNYKYKNGENGTRHSFVIIDENNYAVDIDYFGFLISSQIKKSKYTYNKVLKKNSVNSIVKCDDLIKINQKNIKFKIGEVAEKDLEEFINLYKKYLKSN